MKRIFISYSRADEAFATQIARALREVGADVWIDTEDIAAGEKWSSAIQDGLDTSDAMLVIISPDAMASSNVEDEWQYFMDRKNPAIPVLWQPAKMHFQLNRLQYIDFYGQPFGDAFSRLLDELQRKGIDLKVRGAEDTWMQAGVNPVNDTNRVTAIAGDTPQGSATSVDDGDNAPPMNYGSLLIGIVMMVVVSGALGLPFLIGLTPGDVRYEPPQSGLWLTGIVEVHENSTGNSGLFNVIDPVITERFSSEGDIWYQVEGRNETGYQIEDFLTDDVGNTDLLRLVPYSLALPQTEITLYTAADSEAPASTVEIERSVRFYGYTFDEDGNEWFRVELYSFTQEDTIVGWLSAEDVPVENLVPLPIIADTNETTDAWRDSDLETFSMRLRSNTEMRVLERTDDAYYAGIFQDSAWHLVWIAAEDVTINAQAAAGLR